MLLFALFRVLFQAWHGCGQIQGLGLISLSAQHSEQAEAPSLHIQLHGYRRWRTRQELSKAGDQQGCSEPGMCRCLRQDTELRKL